jgi:hypothetical protein
MENQNTNGNQLQKENQAPAGRNKKPLGLSLLIIFAFVYNGLLLVLMLAGLFYHDIVLNILQQYYPQVYISPTTSLLLTLAGILIFGISFFGLILIWQFRRNGIYYYIPAQLTMLLVLVLLLKSYDYTNIAIAVVVMIIFGLYARDMNGGKQVK